MKRGVSRKYITNKINNFERMIYFA